MRKQSFDVVILANGTFPTHQVPLSVLSQARQIIACDGAAVSIPDANPIIIGDGDSVPDELNSQLIRIDEQEDNDLTKATRYSLQRGWHQIAYLGCTGKREDHTIGNISLLMRYYRDWGVDAIMFTDYGYFTPVEGCRTFDSMPGQQVSIFNFGSMHIRSEGLKWQAYAYQEWWQGTLNESAGHTFSIDADGYYMVYRTYEPKGVI